MSESVTRVMQILEGSDLGADYTVAQVLDETTARRSLDLSDLSPQEQAALVEGRAINMIPSAAALAEKITAAQAARRPFVVKYGIDPTSPDVHLGHAVPIIIASRFQRMGHHVVFIIGDVTAKIGDPSGRSSERPALTDGDIARNLSTYQQQVTPFIDFERADLRFNGEWLNKVSLPQLVEILARVPVSMSLQREDFRTRLAEGQGLSVAEFVYSVVMAMDSVAITADVELGGVDQLLNLQMCRKVMAISDQKPEIVITTPLIEGTDGTGAKMSKSKGNYVGLTASPDDVYGRMMSIPDHLTDPYLKLLTEWTDEEIEVITRRLAEGTAHPMAVKHILAGDVVAALHGLGRPGRPS
nr:tyrosine--tRNA ligase [Streptomyces sp. AP-93]